MTVLSYLDSDKRAPMNREQTDLFIRCTVAEQVKSELFNEQVANECGPVGQILYHRLQLQGPVQITVGLAVFIMSLTGGVPGKIVMWGYTLNRMFKRKAESIGGHLTIDDLAFCFPMGFPVEEEENRLWDAQKGHLHNFECDNMVDQMDTWLLTEPSEEPNVTVADDQGQE